MKPAYLVSGLVAGLFAVTACTSTSTESETSTAGATPPAWTCSAQNLVNSQYSGGGTAYIHLRGYGSGGRYRVTRQGDSTVTGTTKDGTPFTCTR